MIDCVCVYALPRKKRFIWNVDINQKKYAYQEMTFAITFIYQQDLSFLTSSQGANQWQKTV